MGNVFNMITDSRTRFLNSFPRNKRSTVAKEFLDTVRSGNSDPGKIVTAVLQKTLPVSHYSSKGYIAEAIQQYMNAARSYAVYCIDYENLSSSEKEIIKRARKSEAVKAHSMVGKPITAGQILFLRNLGHTGDCPADRAEASDLIVKLTFQKECV